MKSRLSWLIRRGKPTASPAEEGGASALPVRWWELAGFGVLLVAALVMRLWDLGARALHHDESLHAFYSWNLYDGNGFQHNPMMHGPLQFEANAAIFLSFGDTDYTARLLYALVGTAMVGLPFFFRGRLGRSGALFVAAMLAFSPAMLYFSRFARGDILMATWTLGLVICMWRYMDEWKHRYIYIASGLLALAFSTKEVAYLLTAILGLFLALVSAPILLAEIRRRIPAEEAPTPVALWRIVAAAWSAVRSGIKLSEIPRPAAFLLILVTLTLPQWSALASIFQDTPLLSWSNLVLANPEGVNPIGAPSGGGILIAALVVIGMLGLSAYAGFKWNWGVWWKSAVIFYAIWVLLYTTFFTNIDGIGSGMWQGLGYWLAQQDVARGGQPWYYYFVITPLYQFLPLLFSVIAIVFYLRKRNDLFGRFLVFWVVATFILYTLATEKMPWLLVHVTLPLILLSGRFLGEVAEGIEWRRVMSGSAWLLLPGVPIFLFLLWQLAFFGTELGFGGGMGALAFLVISVLALAASGVYLARLSGLRNFAASAAIVVALILLVLTARTAAIASYRNGDTPVEMIVYTQTSPDIARLVKEIEKNGADSVPVAIDQTSGFTWPWAWYLRDNKRVSYPSYSNGGLKQPPDSPVVVVHSQNRADADKVLAEKYGAGELVRHRWWFPESTYRDLTPGKFLRGFVNRETWVHTMNYFLFRKGVRDRLGSENAYVYFSNDMPHTYKPME